jgi:hypothetical protein
MMSSVCLLAQLSSHHRLSPHFECVAGALFLMFVWGRSRLPKQIDHNQLFKITPFHVRRSFLASCFPYYSSSHLIELAARWLGSEQAVADHAHCMS